MPESNWLGASYSTTNMEFYDSDQEIEKRTELMRAGSSMLKVKTASVIVKKVINELTENRVLCWQPAVALVKSRETRNRLPRGVGSPETTIENNWRARSVIKTPAVAGWKHRLAKFWKRWLTNAIRCTKRLPTSPFAPTIKALRLWQTRLFICRKATNSSRIIRCSGHK